MNDIFQPFAIGNGPTPPEAVETPAKVRGPRRGPKAKKAKAGNGRRKKLEVGKAPDPVALAAELETVRLRNQPVPVKARRPRKARAVKIDLATAVDALAGLSSDDAKLLSGMMQALQPFNKKARARIVGALGRVFA